MVRQEFAKVRRGRDACGMFRQSRSLTDSTGAVWWGDLWSGSTGVVRRGNECLGSLGQARFHLARFGWAGLHWNGSAWIGKLGIEMVRQEMCKGRAIHGWDGCDRAVKVGKVATRNGEVRSGEAAAAWIVFERHGVVR